MKSLYFNSLPLEFQDKVVKIITSLKMSYNALTPEYFKSDLGDSFENYNFAIVIESINGVLSGGFVYKIGDKVQGICGIRFDSLIGFEFVDLPLEKWV